MMAKCGLCSAKKGKRYCSPLDNVICPVCCGENRMVKIDCNDDCRYLEGITYQQKRLEDKEISQLMSGVGHGQYDDIFQQPAVAMMAFEIESLICEAYVKTDMTVTDTSVYEAYKGVYRVCFQGKEKNGNKSDELTEALLKQYETNYRTWQENLNQEKMGQVYLRLMISVKNMSGGRFGEYGYLNYLKNNLGEGLPGNEFMVEDKFGNKEKRKLK